MLSDHARSYSDKSCMEINEDDNRTRISDSYGREMP